MPRCPLRVSFALFVATTKHKRHKVCLYAKLSAHETRNTFCPQFRFRNPICIPLCRFFAAFSHVMHSTHSRIYNNEFEYFPSFPWRVNRPHSTGKCVVRIYIVPYAVLHAILQQPKGIHLHTSCLINMPQHPMCLSIPSPISPILPPTAYVICPKPNMLWTLQTSRLKTVTRKSFPTPNSSCHFSVLRFLCIP